VRTLQAGLGVAADGVVGPVTIEAAEKANTDEAINDLCDRRLRFLQGLSTFPCFGRGWTRRVADIRKTALAMVPTAGLPEGTRSFDMTILTGYRTYVVAAFMLIAGLAQ